MVVCEAVSDDGYDLFIIHGIFSTKEKAIHCCQMDIIQQLEDYTSSCLESRKGIPTVSSGFTPIREWEFYSLEWSVSEVEVDSNKRSIVWTFKQVKHR